MVVVLVGPCLDLGRGPGYVVTGECVVPVAEEKVEEVGEEEEEEGWLGDQEFGEEVGPVVASLVQSGLPALVGLVVGGSQQLGSYAGKLSQNWGPPQINNSSY